MLSATIFLHTYISTRHLKCCLDVSLCVKTKINVVIAKIFLNTQSEMIAGVFIAMVTLVNVYFVMFMMMWPMMRMEGDEDGSKDEDEGEEENAILL